jgi:hypothetical protein
MKSLRFVCSFAAFMFAILLIARPAGASAQVAPAAHQPQDKFAKVVRYDSGGIQATSLAIGDVNGDGITDLVVANFQGVHGGNGEVSVLLGNADGTFQPALTFGSNGWLATSVAIGDLNGDGKLDLVVTNDCITAGNCPGSVGSVSVLLGNGDGTFQPAVSYSTGAYYADTVAIGDVNGDGIPDLVVGNFCQTANQYGCTSTGAVSILLGNGDGTFQSPTIFNSGGYWADSVAITDLNGDGFPDLVVVNWCTGNQYGECGQPEGAVSVLLGNGDGTVQPAVNYSAGGYYAQGLAIGDLNGDGHLDLAVGSCSPLNGECGYTIPGNVGVLLGNGDGTFQPVVTYYSGGSSPRSITIADMNGDGIPDLVVANATDCDFCDYGVGVLLGRGKGTFDAGSTYLAGGAGADSVAITDLNGDGKPDVVVADLCAKARRCPGEGELGVLLNNFMAKTATRVTSSLNPAQANQPVTFTATITSGSAVPNGEVVTFYDDGTEIGTGTTANGVATLTTSFSTAGKYTIAASYPGDLFREASSGRVKQVVKP